MAKCFHKALSIAGALLLLFPLFLLPLAAAQQAAPGLSNRMAEAPVKISGIPYQPMNRRDPFLNPLELKKTQKPMKPEFDGRGVLVVPAKSLLRLLEPILIQPH